MLQFHDDGDGDDGRNGVVITEMVVLSATEHLLFMRTKDLFINPPLSLTCPHFLVTATVLQHGRCSVRGSLSCPIARK